MPTLSRTALLVAAYRARASARPSPICEDPWAPGLAGEEGMALAAEQDRWFPHLELWTAVRTAYLDAQVRWWTGAGWGQVVLLGAGLDTRAARLAREGVRFFEVDQPATQAYKRERIAALPGYPAGAATYVECDFEHDDFVERLAAAGLAADQPALVLWEGVTPYLSEGAIRATLRRVAGGLDPRSILLFDHLLQARPPSGEPEARARKKDTRDFVGQLGEPVRFGIKDPVPMLAECGFRHVRSLSFDEATLTFTGNYLREREFRFQRIVFASVRPSGTLTPT
jgi:methyltransferase (TIGR00027 family)